MILKVNHEFSDRILTWLYDNCEIKGNEDYLINEPFRNFLSDDEFIRLENFLSDEDDIQIDLPKDLILMEDKETEPEMDLPEFEEDK